MSEYDLCDIYRVHDLKLRRLSWRQKAPLIQRRLDYIFVSSELQKDVSDININPSIGSHHSTLYLDISLSKHADRGRDYWKFNSSLQEDRIFVEKLNIKFKT